MYAHPLYTAVPGRYSTSPACVCVLLLSADGFVPHHSSPMGFNDSRIYLDSRRHPALHLLLLRASSSRLEHACPSSANSLSFFSSFLRGAGRLLPRTLQVCTGHRSGATAEQHVQPFQEAGGQDPARREPGIESVCPRPPNTKRSSFFRLSHAILSVLLKL